MRILFDLYIAFFKIGLFTFGGGYAMLPMLQREIVEKHGWAAEDEILDYFAIGQCTPGVIAVNTATFIGTKLCDWIGGAVATLAIVSPSFIIISLISALLDNFAAYPLVQHAFAGIRVAVAASIVVSVSKLFKKGVNGAAGYSIFAAALLLSVLFDLSPVWIVAAAMVFGIARAASGRKQV